MKLRSSLSAEDRRELVHASQLVEDGLRANQERRSQAAIEATEQARQIRGRLLGEEHPDYARTLVNLAVVYTDRGDYAKAEPLYLQCREIQRKVLGEEHLDYATTLARLANFYRTTGITRRPSRCTCSAVRSREKCWEKSTRTMR